MGTHLQSLLITVLVSDGRPEHHPASGGFLFTPAALLVGESVLHVDVSLFKDADAVAGGRHVFSGIHDEFYDYGAVDFSFSAGCRIFPADTTSLVEHMWRYFAHIRTDEDLKQH